GLGGRGHVRALGDSAHAVGDQHPCRVLVQLVLGGRRDRDVDRHLPDVAAFDETGARATLGVLDDAAALDLLDLTQQAEVDPGVVDDVAGGVGCRDRACAELGGLLDRVDRHVARTRDRHALALEGLPVYGEHLLHEEHGTVTGGLGAHLRAAPADALTGEDAGLVAVGDLAVHAEHVADLAAADADVARGDVGVLADVAEQLVHERLAEAHDLGLAPAVRVEVRAALAAADALTGERVLEDLLEAEEFDDRDVHRGVEAQSALVRAERGVVLHPVAAVDLHLAGVVDPRHAEDDLPLGLDQTFEHAI